MLVETKTNHNDVFVGSESDIYSCFKLFMCTATDIKARERTSPREAAELLVDQLLNCSEPGWFQSFIDALKATGTLMSSFTSTS